MKTVSRLKSLVWGVGLLCAASAQAALVLPASNPMATQTYNSFEIYSLDLLNKCSSDPRCQPAGTYPVKAGPGQIKDQIVILTGASGQAVTSNVGNGPFANGTPVDGAFSAVTGNGLPFSMTAAGEPGGSSFAGDTAGRWDVRIGDLRNVLGSNDLVFIFDNNQQGANQWVSIWAQARIVDINGALVNGHCFEVSSLSGGCSNVSADPTPAGTDYLVAVGNFCVDKITGVSYNIGTAGNANGCQPSAARPDGGYYISNNLGTNAAEFAAYNASLNDLVMGGAYDDHFLQINLKYVGNNAGAEQLWICTECRVNVDTPNEVSEPAALALLGAGFLGAGWAARRRRTHQA